MPKRVPVEAKRVSLNCLVLPETLAWLKSADVSQGVAVDQAVAKARDTESWQGIAIAAGRAHDAAVNANRRYKGPLLKPFEKKK